MSSLTDSAVIFRYHRAMIARHGNSGTGALGWTDPRSQLSRFAALSAIDDLNGLSILDAGCGHADLCDYLRKIYPDVAYTGLEQIPELITEAVKRYSGQPKTNFIEGNFMTRPLPGVDYIFASGSLSYRSDTPQFIFRAIAKLFASARKGLGFNLLRKIEPNDILVSYDPYEIITYCETLANKVVKIDDYAPEDFTVFMYH